MTLMELLLVIVIAGMVISLALMGMGMAERQYGKARLSYDAQVMAEEIAAELVEQLRYAGNPMVEEERVICSDLVTGNRCEIRAQQWKQEPGERTDGLAVCRLGEDRPVFSWDDSGRCIVISFGICGRDGEILAWIEERVVRILNP